MERLVALAHCPPPANDDGAVTPRDHLVEAALELMRTRPEEPWTVDRLAKAVGCSRATFARRFAKVVGASPLALLTALRLQGAARRLVSSADGLASIAAAVGYGSEFAFGRTFKRHFGVSPGVFRRSVTRPSIATRAVA